jgi:hypothetical protein
MPKQKELKKMSKKEKERMLNALKVRQSYYRSRVRAIESGLKPAAHGYSLTELRIALKQLRWQIAVLQGKVLRGRKPQSLQQAS